MRVRKSLVLISAVIFLAVGALMLPAVNSALAYYRFSILTPAEVIAEPGAPVTIDGGVLVTGMYWLHQFNITVSGLPFSYTMTPSYWQDAPILREWNPQQGVFRVPNNFTLTMNIPSDASGVYMVTLTGTEHQSWRQATNSTYFVLRVGAAGRNATVPSMMDITDIIVPDIINESQPFNLTFKIDNNAPARTAATVGVLIPKEWKADAMSKTFSIGANSSEIGVFTITPTTPSGNVSLVVSYPFNNTVISFTKVGPYLITGENMSATTTTTVPSGGAIGVLSGAISALVSFVNAAFGGAGANNSYLAPITIGVIIILVIVIIWLLGGIFKVVQSGRKEPEKMKSQADIPAPELKTV